MLRMNVQRLQQRQHRRAKQTIQECGKSQLFHFQTCEFQSSVTYDARRKAVYPSHAASAIRAATGTHKPHRKPRKASAELMNIA